MHWVRAKHPNLSVNHKFSSDTCTRIILKSRIIYILHLFSRIISSFVVFASKICVREKGGERKVNFARGPSVVSVRPSPSSSRNSIFDNNTSVCVMPRMNHDDHFRRSLSHTKSINCWTLCVCVKWEFIQINLSEMPWSLTQAQMIILL